MEYLLLGTSGCHLCELAREMLAELQNTLPVVVTEIDIAEQTQWQNAYALKIPVLLQQDSGRRLSWPFTQNELRNFIQELNHDPKLPN